MNKIKKLLNVLIPLCVLTFVIIRSKAELETISFKEVITTITELTNSEAVMVVLFGVISVLVMSLYDATLVKYLKIDLPMKRYIRIGFISNAINSVLGFGGIAGASIRHTTYRSYISDSKKLLVGITWMTTAVLNGLSIFSIFILIHLFPAKQLLLEKPIIIPVVIIIACFAPGYLLLTYIKKRRQTNKSEEECTEFKMTTTFTVVSFVEWSFAAVLLFIILHVLGVVVPFRVTMGVFVISAIMGFISFVPGGFGSFDLTFLLGMSFYGLEEERIISALLLYRIVYYFIPFFIAILLAIFEFSGATLRKLDDNPIITPTLETTGVIRALYREFLSKIGYWALSVLLLYAAWLNITSALLPPIRESFFSTHWVDFSYDITLAWAIILLVNLSGVYHRTKISFVFVMIALVGSIIAHIIKGFDFEEALILCVIVLIMFSVRKQFEIESIIYTIYHGIRTLVVVLLSLAIYLYVGIGLSSLDSSLDYRSFSQIVEATVFALLFVPSFIVIVIYIFNKIRKKEIGIPFDKSMLQSFLQKFDGNSLTHLAFMGDKRIFLSTDEKAIILFRRFRNRLVVLGDPIGEVGAFQTVLNEFMQEANRLGFVVVFYQIDQSNMHLYHDFGYLFFKLGEEAIVDLQKFTLSGKKRAGLRATFNRFEREGYTFEVIKELQGYEINELSRISNEWLGKKKEKGFSIGVFSESYIKEAPVAILRNNIGEAVAFATIMPMYRDGIISVDLMRHKIDVPSGVMDALFLHLFDYARNEGYQYFNLGMAPLANVGTQNEAFLSERIAANVYNNIQYMYSFSGLRKFKEKYHPNWQGKYLAYRKNKTLVASIISVTRMISRGNKEKPKEISITKQHSFYK